MLKKLTDVTLVRTFEENQGQKLILFWITPESVIKCDLISQLFVIS